MVEITLATIKDGITIGLHPKCKKNKNKKNNNLTFCY